MNNNTLTKVIGVVGGTLILAFVVIMIYYDGDKTLVISGLLGIGGLVGTQLLSLKASIDNSEKLEIVDHKIEESVEKIDENTAKTELTHSIVNSRMDEFKQALEDMAIMKTEIAAVKSELAAANELARGITIGREQKVQENI